MGTELVAEADCIWLKASFCNFWVPALHTPKSHMHLFELQSALLLMLLPLGRQRPDPPGFQPLSDVDIFKLICSLLQVYMYQNGMSSCPMEGP